MTEVKADKEPSGSVKIDPKVHQEMTDLCKTKGWVISVFVTEAVRDRIKSTKDQDK